MKDELWLPRQQRETTKTGILGIILLIGTFCFMIIQFYWLLQIHPRYRQKKLLAVTFSQHENLYVCLVNAAKQLHNDLIVMGVQILNVSFHTLFIHIFISHYL